MCTKKRTKYIDILGTRKRERDNIRGGEENTVRLELKISV